MRLYSVSDKDIPIEEDSFSTEEEVWREKVRFYGVALLGLMFLWTCGRFVITMMWNRVSDAKFRAAANMDVVVNPHNNGVVYPVSYWSDPGRRGYQEDTHMEIKGRGYKDSSLYGVWDGHGGYRAAHFCKEFLLRYAVDDEEFVENTSVALRRSFYKADAEFSAIAKLRFLSDGTTSLVACIHNRRLYVANAGDCRAVLVSSDWKATAMSDDHKPNRADEEKRIRQLGGRVVHLGRWRVQGVLAVSRAIGDVSLQPFVTCEPEIEVKELQDHEDSYLILASDGIWDVMTNADAVDVVKQAIKSKPYVDVAKELCAQAIALGSTDNVTASIIDLRTQ